LALQTKKKVGGTTVSLATEEMLSLANNNSDDFCLSNGDSSEDE